MIPIRDTIRSRSFPFVNWLIIILNSLIFFYQFNLSSGQLDRLRADLRAGSLPNHRPIH